MQTAIELRGKLAASEKTLGFLFTHHRWIDAIEMFATIGFDYIIAE